MLHSGSLPLLCGPSRLRWLWWLAALSLSSVTLAEDHSCLPVAGAQEAVADAEPQAPSPGDQIDITSDNATLGVNGDATLEGNVRVRQGGREIRAESVRYDGDTNAFRVDGRVEYTDRIVQVRGNDGQYSPAAGAQFNEAEFELRERAARGAARSVDLTPGGTLRLSDVTFTTCPVNDPAWQLRAGNLTLDTARRIGSGRDARVDFKGVPILYLPWLSFPLGTERKSGFLFPSVGHSTRSGLQLAVPFYWNIAPNADFTFEPLYYARRGTDLSGELRHLTHRYRSELQFHYLPSDDLYQPPGDPLLTGSKTYDRSFVRFDHVAELPGEFRLRLDAANVSDDDYFEDFGQGPEGTSVAFVERLAQLSYRDENWRFAVEAQQFQTIFRDLTLLEQPYARLPRIAANADFGWGRTEWLRYGFDSEVVNFHRSAGVTGWRMDIAPTLALDLEGAGYFFRPGAAWRHTQYSLDDVLPAEPSSPSRTLPIASLDAGLLFERPAGSRRNRTLTLEPRLLYLYTPFRAQDELPIFDTGMPDLNLVQLFRTNRYVGADRVSDANQVSVGVTSRLLDTASGTQFISAALGQTYYFDAPKVRLPGEVTSNRHQSDLIAQLTLTAYRNWNVDLGLQWNPDSSQSERSQVRLQYKPADDRVANVGYRFQRDRLEQAELSGAWTIGRRWAGFGRLVYSLRDSAALERFAGLEYRSCCWRLRAVGRRFVSSRTGEQDTGFYLQLELTGLASVGSAADAFLEEAIRGYSRPDPIP